MRDIMIEGAYGPVRVAPRGFYLYDVCSEVSKDLATEKTFGVRQVEDAVRGQYRFHAASVLS